MKIVQGFRGGLPVLGVRMPVLPSIEGDLTSSESTLESGVAAAAADVEGSGAGVEAEGGAVLSGVLAPPFSERSLSFFSFLSLRFAFSLSAGAVVVVVGAVPFTFGLSVLASGGGVDALDLLARCGGIGRSGAGVGPFVGGVDAGCCCWTAGRAEVLVLGVGAIAAVRR